MRLVHRVLGRREFGIKGIREFNKNSQMALSLDFKKNEYWRSGTSFGAGLLNWRGPELVTNGGFDSATGWGTANVWVISGGVATISNNQAALVQSMTPKVGTTYEISLDVNVTAGSVYIGFLGGTNVFSPNMNAGTNGRFTYKITANSGNNELYIGTGAGTTATVDNVSVREVAATYTRSGGKDELNASGAPVAFAANVPGIVPGVGYWSRASLTNVMPYSGPTKAQLFAADSGVSDTTAPTGSFPFANWIALDNTLALQRAYETVSALTSAAVYTAVCFVQTPDGSSPKTSNASDTTADFRFVSGSTEITASNTTYTRCGTTNVWRVTAQYTTTGADTVAGIIRRTTHDQRALKFSGFQLVPGSDPGPIIVTTGSAATVGADVLVTQDAVPATGDFTLIAIGATPAADSAHHVLACWDNNNGASRTRVEMARGSAGNYRYTVQQAGAVLVDNVNGIGSGAAAPAAPAENAEYRMAVVRSSGTLYLYVSGALVSCTGALSAALTNVVCGARYSDALDTSTLFGKPVSRVLHVPYAMTAAQIASA